MRARTSVTIAAAWVVPVGSAVQVESVGVEEWVAQAE
jgi:hypothetical protein